MPNHSTRRQRVSRKRRVNRKVRSKAIRRRSKKGGMRKMLSKGLELGKRGAIATAKGSYKLGKKGLGAAKDSAIKHDIAGKTKTMPAKFYNLKKFDVTNNFINYCKPLIGKKFPQTTSII